MNSFELALHDELRRVAKEEGRDMEGLMEELAELLKVDARTVYNYRSGKTSPTVRTIPVLCKRFRSQVLAHAIVDLCREEPTDPPELYEITALIAQTVREDMAHYSSVLSSFESDGIDANELRELMVSGERVRRNVSQLEAIAVQDYERRHGARVTTKR